MTVQEYINNNLPFYHITRMENLGNILQYGLLKSREPGARFGICVTRSMNDDVIYEIIDRQLQRNQDEIFALIEILPQKHNLSINDISRDPIDEPIGPMCNYILREPLRVEKEDILRENISVGLWRGTTTNIEALTDYQGAIPPVNRR